MLLFRLAAFGRAAAFRLFGLRLLRLFFHGLPRGFGLLGADFSALLALLLKHFLASDQLDERLLRPAAALEAAAHEARVASFAVAEAGSDLPQLAPGLLGHQKRPSLPPGPEVA